MVPGRARGHPTAASGGLRPGYRDGRRCAGGDSECHARTSLVLGVAMAAVPAEEVKWDIKETGRADIATDDGDREFGAVVGVNEYAIVGYLGEGSFGRVFRGQRRAGGRERDFALKEMSKSRLAKKRELRRVGGAGGETKLVTMLDNVARTCSIHRHLYHRHVMLLFEVINDPDEDRMFLVTEYMAKGPSMWWDNSTQEFHFGPSKRDGSGRGPMPVNTARRFALHAALGLQYLHGLGIVHRDIKPDNLLVNSRDQCVISDLGSAHKFEGEAAAVRALPLTTPPCQYVG